MILPTNRKVFYALALIGIVIMITMPDVLMGLLFELVHFFFELLFHIADIVFEGLETILDNIIEHLFRTELHETQTIVFYLMMGLAIFPVYYLSRVLLRLFFRLKETLQSAFASWILYKARAIDGWQNLSLIDKTKWIFIAAGLIYMTSFLFM